MKNIHYMTREELEEELIEARNTLSSIYKGIKETEKRKVKYMKLRTKLKENDVLYFKNGNTKTYYDTDAWIFDTYYDEDLRCKKNSDFDIIEIKRPYYESIKFDGSDVHTMSRLELETELIERRLQVDSLKKDIIRKDDIIRKYGGYLDDMNVGLKKDFNRKILIKGLEINNESFHKDE